MGGDMLFQVMKSFVLTSLIITLTSSCSGDKAKDIIPTPEENQSCISESVLNTAGIVGGRKVSRADAEANKAVLLLTMGADNEMGICTATAIAPNVVLTAGHCVDLSEEKTAVAIGTGISCESGFNINTDLIKVRRILRHNLYSDYVRGESFTKYDIALVILSENLPSRYQIFKIANPEKVDASSPLRFTGFGTINFKKGGSGIMRSTELPRSGFTYDLDKKTVTVDQSYGTGICTGDSGGAGLVLVNGQEQILGVNSVVSNLGSEQTVCNYKSRLTLAFGHMSWIKERLAAYSILLF